jgi:hypothetical protein
MLMMTASGYKVVGRADRQKQTNNIYQNFFARVVFTIPQKLKERYCITFQTKYGRHSPTELEGISF